MILITEFMDKAAVADLSAAFIVAYEPELAERQDAILERLDDCRALIVRNRTKVTAQLIGAAPRLRCIGRLGVGLDNIDLAAARARGVTVYPATGANDLAVAEYVIAAAMILTRGAYRRTDEVIAGGWPRGAATGREIAGKTLGLVGYGGTARATARLASAVGMRVLAHDTLLPANDPAWNDVARRELPQLLAEADVVSLHVPLTETTRGLIDAAAIARMRRTAILINASRGGVVEEAAAVAALRESRLGGAALDVFVSEPLSADDGASFADAPNLLLTPHVAGVTRESNARVSRLIAQKVAEHLRSAETGG